MLYWYIYYKSALFAYIQSFHSLNPHCRYSRTQLCVTQVNRGEDIPAVERQWRDRRMIDTSTHKHNLHTFCAHTHHWSAWMDFVQHAMTVCYVVFIFLTPVQLTHAPLPSVCWNTNRVHFSHIHNNWWCGAISDWSQNYCRQVSKWVRGGAVQFFNWLAVESRSRLYKYTFTCMRRL